MQRKDQVAGSVTESDKSLLDVRTVSQMTGLAAPNLRMWEKRHRVANPVRSESGRRLYRKADVERLKILKRLVDQGHSIGALASMENEELKSLDSETHLPQKISGSPEMCRIILIGDALHDLFEIPEMKMEGASIETRYDSLSQAEEELKLVAGDLLLVDCPAIFPETIARIERLNEKFKSLRATIFYSFAPGNVLESFSSNRISLVRMPKRVEEVRSQCEREISFAAARQVTEAAASERDKKSASGIPARKFTDRELSYISRISPVLECECPNHLAELLTSLIGFEQYSAECENRNREDARMHAYLHARTAKARSIIEEALQQLMEFEGISLAAAAEDR